MPALKRPSASQEEAPDKKIKAEPKSPAKASPARPPNKEPEQGTRPAAAASNLGPSTSLPKAKAKALPAPDNKAWQDANYQTKALAKKGKGDLQKQWENCRTQAEKRNWYYNIFLLSPEVSVKQVHKSSLEKAKQVSGEQEGWVTKWAAAKLVGIPENHPEFDALADDAVAGLPERPRENPKLAAKDIKQYYYKGKLMTQNTQTNQSETKAHSFVQDMENEHFQQVEDALKVDQHQGQVMLGGRGRTKAIEAPPPETEVKEDNIENDYKKVYQSLRKALTSIGNGLDKLTMLQASLNKAADDKVAIPSQVEQTLVKEIDEWEHMKKTWMQHVIGNYPSTMPEVGPEKGKEIIDQMEKDKKKLENELKTLNKRIGPTKLWARNEGYMK